MKIPKIFHQVWFDFKEGNGYEFPEAFEKYRESWLILHPEWEYRLWTEDDFLKILPQELTELYYSYNKMIKKVDFAKFVILFQFGGVYIDCDEECLKNIEELMGEYDVVLAFDYKIDKFVPNMSIINSFFASIPNHPLFSYLIDACPKFKDNWVCHATGPTFIGKQFYEYYNNEKNQEYIKNIKIYMNEDYKKFYPISWKENAKILKYRHNREQLLIDFPTAYKVSHWSNLWEGNKLSNF